jgi:hypothetical protein
LVISLCVFEILTSTPFRTFIFNIYVGTYRKAPPPPKKLAPKVVAFIKSMRKLDRLVFVVPEYHADVFAQEFTKANVLLSRVETLTVGPFCEFALKMCPNVKGIATNGWMFTGRELAVEGNLATSLIKAAEAAVNLTKLEISVRWTVFLLKGKMISKLLLSDCWYERCY